MAREMNGLSDWLPSLLGRAIVFCAKFECVVAKERLVLQIFLRFAGDLRSPWFFNVAPSEMDTL